MSEYGTGEPTAAVELGGICFGEPLAFIVDVFEEDGDWLVTSSLPVWDTYSLFEFPGYNSQVRLEIDRGQRLTGGSAAIADSWFLPPGEYSVDIPAHFLTGSATRTSFTVEPFAIDDRGYLPSVTYEQIDIAYAEFLAQCGEVCIVTTTADDEPVPTSPVTIESITGTEATYTGGTYLMRPTGEDPGWFDARPESWGKDSPDTGLALIDNVVLEYTPLSCPGQEPCTLDVAAELESANSVKALLFTEIDGVVAISGIG
ncbi:MAG: hypothetical protein ACTHXA_11595 [Gulosibacter sp.]|uniref:hypothetical protein n=1 Tax=Gulosibacter sp. TaxID=2817531 RepID=UPI003F93C48C